MNIVYQYEAKILQQAPLPTDMATPPAIPGPSSSATTSSSGKLPHPTIWPPNPSSYSQSLPTCIRAAPHVQAYNQGPCFSLLNTALPYTRYVQPNRRHRQVYPANATNFATRSRFGCVLEYILILPYRKVHKLCSYLPLPAILPA